MTSDQPTLYLHGGPGLSAIPERALYGPALPIHWWDQARSVVLLRQPLAALIDVAEDELLQLSSQASGAPVHLLAHSFGAVLARELAMRIPGRIAAITLLAPVHDLGDAFVRLGSHLAARPPAAGAQPRMLLEALREALARLLAERESFACFLDLVHAILSLPDFLDAYFRPGDAERRDWLARLMASEPVFDLDAFTAIARDHWNTPQLAAVSHFRGPVRIVYGDADTLVDAGASLPVWQRCFRRVSSEVAQAGHMIQLECAPRVWRRP